ncbi:Uncharacterized protein FWK35_00013720 [Aphis craccivora]|uniref:Uncharacterized protein n=1 Tax=Aphis craccivora TaxID=307492 RepID=A0A6G0YGG7_APHCR|nr:Uncharacterized protein FWK35_00013720 [Aphis craccivora]
MGVSLVLGVFSVDGWYVENMIESSFRVSIFLGRNELVHVVWLSLGFSLISRGFPVVWWVMLSVAVRSFEVPVITGKVELYSCPQKSTTHSCIQIGRAVTVSVARVDGGQCFGEFSCGNARERTNFGCRPEMVSRGPEYIVYVVLHDDDTWPVLLHRKQVRVSSVINIR